MLIGRRHASVSELVGYQVERRGAVFFAQGARLAWAASRSWILWRAPFSFFVPLIMHSSSFVSELVDRMCAICAHGGDRARPNLSRRVRTSKAEPLGFGQRLCARVAHERPVVRTPLGAGLRTWNLTPARSQPTTIYYFFWGRFSRAPGPFEPSARFDRLSISVLADGRRVLPAGAEAVAGLDWTRGRRRIWRPDGIGPDRSIDRSAVPAEPLGLVPQRRDAVPWGALGPEPGCAAAPRFRTLENVMD